MIFCTIILYTRRVALATNLDLFESLFCTPKQLYLPIFFLLTELMEIFVPDCLAFVGKDPSLKVHSIGPLEEQVNTTSEFLWTAFFIGSILLLSSSAK